VTVSLANDEGQAADDLDLAKKLVTANPIISREVDQRAKEIIRKDGRARMQILPARDIAGAHGKTYSFVGFDEIHAYRSHGLFEALAPDPTRQDTLTWASIFWWPAIARASTSRCVISQRPSRYFSRR
jgi:hypothetical protein